MNENGYLDIRGRERRGHGDRNEFSKSGSRILKP